MSASIDAAKFLIGVGRSSWALGSKLGKVSEHIFPDPVRSNATLGRTQPTKARVYGGNSIIWLTMTI